MTTYQITNNQITINDFRNVILNLDGRRDRMSSIKLFFDNNEFNQFTQKMKSVNIIKLSFCYGNIIFTDIGENEDNSVTIHFVSNCWY